MPVHTRNPLLLFGTFGITPAAAAVSAYNSSTGANRSNAAYIGDAQNVTITIYNGDAATNSTFMVWVASNVNGAPGMNYTPSLNDWAPIWDASTGVETSISVGFGTTVGLNIPNVAAPLISITSSAALSSCLAFCNASI